MALFLAAQVILHLAFGVVAWCLGWATTVVSPRMRGRFGQVIVLWLCLLVAAVITYNAVWYPWTGLGEYYYSIVTTPLGPLAVGRVFYLLVLAFAAFTLMWQD